MALVATTAATLCLTAVAAGANAKTIKLTGVVTGSKPNGIPGQTGKQGTCPKFAVFRGKKKVGHFTLAGCSNGGIGSVDYRGTGELSVGKLKSVQLTATLLATGVPGSSSEGFAAYATGTVFTITARGGHSRMHSEPIKFKGGIPGKKGDKFTILLGTKVTSAPLFSG